MGALFILLPDRREGPVVLTRVNDLLYEHATTRPAWSFRPMATVTSITAYRSFGSGVGPDTMLALLRQIDWAYPAKLLYRTESENGWSFVTLGLSLRPEGA